MEEVILRYMRRRRDALHPPRYDNVTGRDAEILYQVLAQELHDLQTERGLGREVTKRNRRQVRAKNEELKQVLNFLKEQSGRRLQWQREEAQQRMTYLQNEDGQYVRSLAISNDMLARNEQRERDVKIMAINMDTLAENDKMVIREMKNEIMIRHGHSQRC
ncbi:uncharacterized protein LOC113318717 isoform X1 [Papaver somniferum]|uniref:uncharacterized protein LOC113318717 isoform X1 n=1 Tax=Papaver somniferum TaxID=3469 RepID=UPI000E702C2D|nr:uncharacterized protein LOC113318717 isoform X1 [Papaver somniferum]